MLNPLRRGIIVRKLSYISKSRGRKTNKTYHFGKKSGHLIAYCCKLKNKKEGEKKNKQSQKTAKVDFVGSESDGDVLLATASEKRKSTE